MTNGQAYFFKLTAINSVGTGPYSSASAVVTPALPNLVMTTTHTGKFMFGVAGASYHLQVANIGGRTDGTTVTVIDTLPTGLNAETADATGTGWNCFSDAPTASTTVTCTRADVLAADSLDEITNTASVQGGGDHG